MNRFKIAVPAIILLGGFLVCTTASFGTQEYTKQTKKACGYCHVQAAPKKGDPKATELKAPGQYFQAHNKSLDGYKEAK